MDDRALTWKFIAANSPEQRKFILELHRPDHDALVAQYHGLLRSHPSLAMIHDEVVRYRHPFDVYAELQQQADDTFAQLKGHIVPASYAAVLDRMRDLVAVAKRVDIEYCWDLGDAGETIAAEHGVGLMQTADAPLRDAVFRRAMPRARMQERVNTGIDIVVTMMELGRSMDIEVPTRDAVTALHSGIRQFYAERFDRIYG